MVPRAPPVVAPPSFFRPDWETLARLASMPSKLLDLDACPAPTSLCWFCDATDKLISTWFWGPNQETVAVILRPKSPNQLSVWGLNWETLHHLGFEAQPRNPRFWSPRARCRPHTAPPDLSTARHLSTRPVRPSPVLCTRSPTRATVLVAARHVAPTSCTPRDKQTRFSERTKDKEKQKQNYPGFEFKPCQVNDSSQSNQVTVHLVSQSPPWWVHWQQKHKVWSSNPRPHEAQLEDQKSKEKLKKVI